MYVLESCDLANATYIVKKQKTDQIPGKTGLKNISINNLSIVILFVLYIYLRKAECFM